MREKIVVLEFTSGTVIMPSLLVKQRPEFVPVNPIYRLGLLYDKILIPNMLSVLGAAYTVAPPYAPLEQFDVFDLMTKLPNPTQENVIDFLTALKEEPAKGVNGSEMLFLTDQASVLKASQVGAHFFVVPQYRDGFLGLCLKYNADYLDTMKESFLSFELLDFIFREQVSSFDPNATLDRIAQFIPFKTDFQSGVFSLLEDLKGYYKLSADGEKYVREKLSAGEAQLLELLRPENLAKLNIGRLDTLADIGSALSTLPIPTGTIINLIRKIRSTRDFKRKKLDFNLALYILKTVGSAKTVISIPKCRVCGSSEAEIENMSQKECNELVFSHKFCIVHTITYLSIRKRLGRVGKELLLAMKRLTSRT